MTSREAEIQARIDGSATAWTMLAHAPADLAYLLARVATLEAQVAGQVCAHQNDAYLNMMRERDALRAQVAAVREAVDDCPPCEVHPDGGPVTCGWKYAVADVRAALDSAAAS